jgi:hypothetical protein
MTGAGPYRGTTPHGWNVFAHDRPLLTHTYSFVPGESTALALGTDARLFG